MLLHQQKYASHEGLLIKFRYLSKPCKIILKMLNIQAKGFWNSYVSCICTMKDTHGKQLGLDSVRIPNEL